jgi:diguanylate cyclase (GGDEF)-like protein/PAS domain S-box-containing protein
MSDVLHPTRRLFLLDLRIRERAPEPALPGLAIVTPNPRIGDAENGATPLAVLVAIDREQVYADWQRRFLRWCPRGFPHIVLLDPWSQTLALRIVQGGAVDCCAMDDLERIELALTRLEHHPRAAAAESLPPSALAHSLSPQAALDTLPIPVFIQDRSRRYTACNRAFAEYLGLAAGEIVGKTVFDVAPGELAAIYDRSDVDHLAQGGTRSYESQVRHADGSLHDVVFHKAIFLDPAGEPDGIVGAILDISERKALERRLELLAATDFLTGVYNLRTFYELARHEVSRLTRNGGDLALVVIDIDHFKGINDSLGHAAGDNALKQFVTVVHENLREQDIFARAGGDEFRLLLPDTSPAGAYLVAERIRSEVNKIIVRSHRGRCRLSVSIGIAQCLPGEDSIDIATGHADDALYEAKAAGRNCIHPLPEKR